MENNHLFEADAVLDAGDEEQNRAGYKNGNNAGLKAAVAANGGYDEHITSRTSEETPLLPEQSGTSETEHNDGGNTNSYWPGATDFEGMPWWKTPSVYWLLPSYGLFAIAFGGIIVPRINLVVSLICREYLADRSIADPAFGFMPVLLGEDNPQCQIPEIQALSTKFLLYIVLISAVLAAVTSPKIGTLSDRYGRKPLLALTTSGGLLAEVLTILAAKYPDSFHYSWLLVGAAVDGLCGSFIASWAMTHSYAADCTAPAKRAVSFGYLHACLFIGIAVGPIIAAYVVEATGTILTVFYFAIVCHLTFLSYIIFVIPESLALKRQLAAREKHNREISNDSGMFSALRAANLLEPLKILYPTGEGSSPQVRMNLLLLSAVDTILFGTAMASMTVVLLYSEYEFHWGNKETNLFVSLANTSRVTALMVILPLLNYLVRTRYKNRVRRESGIELVERNSGSDNLDLWTIRASVLFEIVGYGGYVVVRTGPLFVMSGIFASLGGIGSPTLQSALTKHVPHDRTGQLLGATGLLHALARVVWPTGISLLYASTVDSFPQTVFIVLAGGFVAAFVCSLFVKPHIYLEEPGAKPATDREDEIGDLLADEETAAI